MALISLDKVLGTPSGEGLSDLVRHAREMTGLAAALRAALPEDARPHLVAANLRDDGALVLVCGSPSWAARLRFEGENLLAAARASGVTASRVTVKVARR